MGMTFCFDPVTGKHEDIVVHRPYHEKMCQVSLGDRNIGMVSGPDDLTGWTAISSAQPPRLIGLRMVNGFKSRWLAVDYLLNVGVRLPDNKCIPELDHHPLGYHDIMGDGQCFPPTFASTSAPRPPDP
jgi:hypothetical protein